MTAATDTTSADDVLDFWFGPVESPERGRDREAWFSKDEAFDREVRERFGAVIERGIAGALAAWRASGPDAALAEIVVLDQFPRNAFRGTAKAFAGDRAALAAARRLVASGDDRRLLPVMRLFAYLPFEHAEDLAMQHEALRLFRALGEAEPSRAGQVEWADKHRVIVERFGRFPHRNLALGRVSTPEEAAFLAQPGSSF